MTRWSGRFQMPRVNLLIADDVGLGKTIEAGLVMQELILRHRARTMLIVCPAGLTLQWRDQMRDKFGLDFRIVDTSDAKELRRSRGIYANPWTHFPRLIIEHRLAQAGPAAAAAARDPAGSAEVPAQLRPADRRRGAHLRPVGRAASTPWTRCAPRRSARWRRTSSTGCSCRPPRTTATWSRSPRCWNCWTTSASCATSGRRGAACADHGAPAQARAAAQVGRHAPVPAPGDEYLEVEHTAEERAAHQLLAEYAASRRKAGGRGCGPGRRGLRHHAAEEAAVLLAEGVRRDRRDAPADHDGTRPELRQQRRPGRGCRAGAAGPGGCARRDPDPAAADRPAGGDCRGRRRLRRERGRGAGRGPPARCRRSPSTSGTCCSGSVRGPGRPRTGPTPSWPRSGPGSTPSSGRAAMV